MNLEFHNIDSKKMAEFNAVNLPLFVLDTNVTIICRNDELSWMFTKIKDSELFILDAENSQIRLKIYVIPILLTFIYLVVLYLLVNNQLNSLSNSTHHCGT